MQSSCFSSCSYTNFSQLCLVVFGFVTGFFTSPLWFQLHAPKLTVFMSVRIKLCNEVVYKVV